MFCRHPLWVMPKYKLFLIFQIIQFVPQNIYDGLPLIHRGLDFSSQGCLHGPYISPADSRECTVHWSHSLQIFLFSSPLLLRGTPDYSIDTMLEFTTEALQATMSEGLAQGPYMAARVGFEPATF